jgi:undecaprenyl-diphosphatase
VVYLNQLNKSSKIYKSINYDKMRRKDNHSLFLYSSIYLLIAMVTLASYMIWHYYSYGQWAMDVSMQDFMRNFRTPWLTPIFKVITSTGETIPVIVGTAIIIIALIIYKKRKEAIMTAIYMLGVWRLNDLLKQLLHRPRIDPSQHLIDISGYSHNSLYSLPSGHSMNFMALILLALYFVWVFCSSKKINLGLTLLLLPYAMLVGISRVYLNVHYFSDVITGWSVGAACAALAIIIHKIINKRHKRTSNLHF